MITSSKIERLARLKELNIAFVSTPTPILMSDELVVSPNRTNYFPFPQVVLATSVKNAFARNNIQSKIHFLHSHFYIHLYL